MARRGFTLIELLVVITIIVVLLALLTPALDRAIYQATLVQCAANQKLMGSAVIQYALENRRNYPQRHIPTDDSSISNYNTASLFVPENPGSDMRPVLRKMGLKINDNLQCPLVEPEELEENIPNEFLYGNQSLWFGWNYIDLQNGTALPGMKRYGDKFFAWDRRTGDNPHGPNTRTYRLNLLVSDFDVWRGEQGSIASHPDRSGQMFNWKVKQANFFGAFTITFSWWTTTDVSITGEVSNPWATRGELDLNYTYDDGSTRRFSDVEMGDAMGDSRAIQIQFAHQGDAGGRQQVPYP